VTVMTNGTTKRMIGEALREIVLSARSGGPLVRVGLMASGSELGPEELAMGAILAMRSRPGLEVVMIGPRLDGYDQLSFIETPDCEEDISKAMELALKTGEISAAVALHYPFPLRSDNHRKGCYTGQGETDVHSFHHRRQRDGPNRGYGQECSIRDRSSPVAGC